MHLDFTILMVSIIGAGLVFALIAFCLIRYGERKEQLKVAQQNRDSNDKAKQTAEAIKQLPDSELRDRISKFVRD